LEIKLQQLVIDLDDEESTAYWAGTLARHVQEGQFLALCGELGAGKTTFTRLLTKELGCRTLATSPTFSLFQQYEEGRLPVFHADLYRLGSEDELFELGWEETIDDYKNGLVVVEWADRFPAAWPGDSLKLTFQYRDGDDERRITCEASGARSRRLLESMRNEERKR
jgi:tRNA threonylcarbamoyladenosine biosynthesis protein TsaE